MFRVHLTWMSVAVALACGCASRRSTERLEAQLRVHEDRATELEKQLASTRQELVVANHESVELRKQLQERGQAAVPPELMNSGFQIQGIGFNSYLTSGIDRDGHPGDEELSVLLFPRDAQGGLVKLPGTIELEVHDLAAPADQRTIGQWTFSAEDTRQAWHNGLLASGYLFELPWQTIPQRSDLTLHARFRTLDGREFDQTCQIRVQPGGSPTTVARRTADRHLTVEENANETLPPPADKLDEPILEMSDKYRTRELPQYR